jgi:hypothetical protein
MFFPPVRMSDKCLISIIVDGFATAIKSQQRRIPELVSHRWLRRGKPVFHALYASKLTCIWRFEGHSLTVDQRLRD